MTAVYYGGFLFAHHCSTECPLLIFGGFSVDIRWIFPAFSWHRLTSNHCAIMMAQAAEWFDGMPTAGCPRKPGKATDMKGGKNTAMPHADEKSGKARRGTFYNPVSGTICKCPANEFPTLERDGVRVVFSPGWDCQGRHAGWGIEVIVPIADALAGVDNALSFAIGQSDTAELWDDIVPTHRRGGSCVLQLACDDDIIRRFIRQARANGFRTADDGVAD